MKELFNIAKKGLSGEEITVPKEVAEDRYLICEGCPHLTRIKTCEICLCSMKLKTKGSLRNHVDYFHNKIRQDILECDADQRVEMRTYRDKQRANFTSNITVESYWNRAILFDPRTWHSADNFFGNTKETSRLNIVFYAKAG